MFFFFSFSLSTDPSGIFSKHFHEKSIIIEASGSTKQDINGSRQLTKPEYAVYPWVKRYDWCSNVGKSYDVHPWIAFGIKKRKMKINGYFMRSGCCYEGCCCEDDYGCFVCCIYSWSLQISDDNITWTEIHKVEKDYSMRQCNQKTYKLDQEYVASYVRIMQTEACPGWPPCIALNKIEFLGETIEDGIEKEDFISFHDDDDDISIIGHIENKQNLE